MIAVQRDAEANHIILQIREIERCRGVCGMNDRVVAACVDTRDKRVESLRLKLCKRRIRFGLCKMRERTGHMHVRAGVERIEHSVELFVVNDADAAHAGVELQMHMRVASGSLGEPFKRIDLLGCKDRAGEMIGDDRNDVIGIGHAEDQDRQRDAVFTQTHAFLRNGDGKHVDKFRFFEILTDLHNAVTVCIGFDDGKKFGFGLQPTLCVTNVFQ